MATAHSYLLKDQGLHYNFPWGKLSHYNIISGRENQSRVSLSLYFAKGTVKFNFIKRKTELGSLRENHTALN